VSLISAEYRCCSHGVFGVVVERDANGDPPECWPCPELILGADESDLDDDVCCDYPSPWTISAPMGRVRTAEVVRGGVDRPDSPFYLDTRKLGEGQPYEEFRAERDKLYAERRHKESKEL
jgi:hypothetical protein